MLSRECVNIASCVGGASGEGQHVLFSISMWLCNTGYMCAYLLCMSTLLVHSNTQLLHSRIV